MPSLRRYQRRGQRITPSGSSQWVFNNLGYEPPSAGATMYDRYTPNSGYTAV